MKNMFYFIHQLWCFINEYLEGCGEKDPEGSLRKCGIINKQYMLEETEEEAVLCYHHLVLGKTTQ